MKHELSLNLEEEKLGEFQSIHRGAESPSKSFTLETGVPKTLSRQTMTKPITIGLDESQSEKKKVQKFDDSSFLNNLLEANVTKITENETRIEMNDPSPSLQKKLSFSQMIPKKNTEEEKGNREISWATNKASQRITRQIYKIFTFFAYERPRRSNTGDIN